MNSTEEKIHIYAWSERFLYLGPSTKTSSHRNHAATWLIACEGKLRVTLASGGVLENQVIYLPSETEYATAIWHRRASRRCIGNWSPYWGPGTCRQRGESFKCEHNSTNLHWDLRIFFDCRLNAFQLERAFAKPCDKSPPPSSQIPPTSLPSLSSTRLHR